MKTQRTRRQALTHRKPKVNKGLDLLGQDLLAEAQSLFERTTDLDTAVREVVHDGLAYIVHAAYDTLACANCVSDLDFGTYIQTKTYEWFRDRGFVEWFCVGASTLFQTTPRSFFRYRVSVPKGKGCTVIKREKIG